MPTAPQTFAELMKSDTYKAIKRFLRKVDRTITVIESPASMGSYSAVILTGKGFQIESGKSGMTAAYTGTNEKYRPLKGGAKKVLETVLRYNDPLDEDDKRPNEAEIVADVLRKIEELRKRKKK